jgi:hypothetical protein
VRRLAVAALVVATGCKTVAHGELYEQSIMDRLHEIGNDADAVHCPQRIPLGVKAENHFECVLVKGGGETTVVVDLVGNGPFEWKLRQK